MDTIDPQPGSRMARFDDAETRRLIESLSARTQSALVSSAEVARLTGADANSQTLQRMCFRVGELGLLFPWEAGREVLSSPSVSRVPNTAAWLSGLANVRGGLVPVVDAAAAFGVTRRWGVPTYMLIFGHNDAAMGLLIDGLPRLISVDIAQRLPDVPRGPALLEDSICAAYREGERTWLDLDLTALFNTLSRNIAL